MFLIITLLLPVLGYVRVCVCGCVCACVCVLPSACALFSFIFELVQLSGLYRRVFCAVTEPQSHEGWSDMYNKTEMSAGSNDEAPPKSSKSQDSFLKRSLRTIQLRQVLRDIEEARTLGVDLFTLSLGEFYARLQEARRQLRQHMNSGQGADTFAYDMSRAWTISNAKCSAIMTATRRGGDRHPAKQVSRGGRDAVLRRTN